MEGFDDAAAVAIAELLQTGEIFIRRSRRAWVLVSDAWMALRVRPPAGEPAVSGEDIMASACSGGGGILSAAGWGAVWLGTGSDSCWAAPSSTLSSVCCILSCF